MNGFFLSLGLEVDCPVDFICECELHSIWESQRFLVLLINSYANHAAIIVRRYFIDEALCSLPIMIQWLLVHGKFVFR